MNKDDTGVDKLPALKIFFEALTLPKKHFLSLLRFGYPLLILITTLEIYTRLFVKTEELTVLATFTVFVVEIIVLVPAVIGAHRTFLLDEFIVRSTKVIRWEGRELRYIGWWIVIMFCISLATIPFLFLPYFPYMHQALFDNIYIVLALMLFANIPVSYLISRGSLILPAIATDKKMNLSRAWSISRGNGWRLTFLISVIPFLTGLVFQFVPDSTSIFYSIIVGAIWLSVGVIEIGLLSLSYSYLSKSSSDAAH